MKPARWGIVEEWSDARGAPRRVEPNVSEALLRAMDADRPTPPRSRVRIARRGEALPEGSELQLEDGTRLGSVAALPPDLPYGYHRLILPGGGERLLLLGPGACHPPPERPGWGWSTQLYATRSSESWGMGDLRDLRRLGEWSARVGASFAVVSPLAAATPPHQPSPYFPSSRRFRNPIYLAVEEVPGAERRPDEVARAATAGRELTARPLIDRQAVWELKQAALEAIWASSTGGPDGELARFVETGGEPLRDWARFSALAERHGADWRRWPAGLRHPASDEVARFAAEEADRVAFHAWLQWLLDRQLSAAERAVSLINDLPIGVDPAGADAWAWQELLAVGASVGAPPDIFNPAGQDWGLAPFNPARLRAAGYGPFIETIRASLRHAGGLRLDHVMGLFRLWWIPHGNRPEAGAYVRYPSEELLEIVAIESHRAAAPVIGEDLGTVEPRVRTRLRKAGILSYRLAWFEPPKREAYPELAMAAATTHDLPTLAGVWTGSDLADASRAGLRPNRDEIAQLRKKAAELSGLGPEAPADEVIARVHEWLAGVRSRLVVATLDDAVAAAKRPNMPGTVTQWPNWSIPLPVLLEDLEAHPLVNRIVAAMRVERPATLVDR